VKKVSQAPTGDDMEDQWDDDANLQEQDVEEDQEKDADDAPKNSGKSAGRLNAIVNAATFLCNADINYTNKMVEIVKKEFSDYSGYVSMLPHKKCLSLCYHPYLSLCVITLIYHYVLSPSMSCRTLR
jgi:hypothetical protein